jgi:hypothetical protein
VRLTIIGALVLVCIAPAVFAQEFYGGPDQQEEYDACQGSLDPDVCMWSPMGGAGAGAPALCNGSFGCPMCGFDMTLTKAVCYRLRGQSGFCSCTAKGTYTDKWGQKQPNCDTSGSCAVR